MAHRKPPSQRPELKMDETAKAIARLREEAKALKTSETAAAIDGQKTRMSRPERTLGLQKVGGAASSHKRQKSGGA